MRYILIALTVACLGLWGYILTMPPCVYDMMPTKNTQPTGRCWR